jgi:hypothetical protein
MTEAFGLKAIEAAFMAAFGITPAAKVAFLGRMQHLQKVGCPFRPKPGRGKAKDLGYQLEHVRQWIIGLILTANGVPPATAATLLHRIWGEVEKWTAQAIDQEAQNGNPVLLVYAVNTLGSLTTEADRSPTISGVACLRRFKTDPQGEFREDIPGVIDWLSAPPPWIGTGDHYPPWITTVNLTHVLLTTEAKLAGEGKLTVDATVINGAPG